MVEISLEGRGKSGGIRWAEAKRDHVGGFEKIDPSDSAKAQMLVVSALGMKGPMICTAALRNGMLRRRRGIPIRSR